MKKYNVVNELKKVFLHFAKFLQQIYLEIKITCAKKRKNNLLQGNISTPWISNGPSLTIFFMIRTGKNF